MCPGLEQIRQMLRKEEEVMVDKLRAVRTISGTVEKQVRDLLLSTERQLKELLEGSTQTIKPSTIGQFIPDLHYNIPVYSSCEK